MEDDNPVNVRHPSPTDNNNEDDENSLNNKLEECPMSVCSDDKEKSDTSQISLDTTHSKSNESDMSLGSETDQKSDTLNLTATRHSWHADETIKGDCIGVNDEIENHRREV